MKKIIALLFSVSLSISLLSQDDLGKDDLRCMPKPAGQGRSKDPADSLLYEMMADDYDALLEAMKIDSADVLGWSDAGINGLLMVIRHQQKVKVDEFLANLTAKLKIRSGSPDTSISP